MQAILKRGDALRLLPTLAPESVDALIVDPPYSSGGLFRGDRADDPVEKYEQHGQKGIHRATFMGDTRDQRSWTRWCALWLADAYRAIAPRGYVLCFTDWRQLPAMTDAFQAAGYVWRGLICWDKGAGARAPHKGYFRHQGEYVVWGTKGASRKATHAGPFEGVIREPVRPKEKFHLCGKPVPLMRKLVICVPPGGVVLDPMMGSGSTGVAAIQTGRKFIGWDLDGTNVATARDRIRAAHNQGG